MKLHILWFSIALSFSQITFAYTNPLHIAAEAGNIEEVKSLISEGADVKAIDGEDEVTALHSAVRAGKAEMVKILIEAGSDVNFKNSSGKTPIMIAIKRIDSFRPNLKLIEVLIKYGADINVKLEYNEPLIHFAAKMWLGKPAIKLLIENGLDVNTRDINGETVLHLVARIGDLDLIKYLIEAGADINARSNNGETPITSAFVEPDNGEDPDYDHDNFENHQQIIALLKDNGGIE